MEPRVVMAQHDGDDDFTLGVLVQANGELNLFYAGSGEQRWVDLTDKSARALYTALDHYLHCESCRAARTAEFCYDKAIKNSVDDR
jgi:hypothetical protein